MKLKTFLISTIFTAISSLVAFAQFTPPASDSTVMVNDSFKLTAPTASVFLNANPEFGRASDISTLNATTLQFNTSTFAITNPSTAANRATFINTNFSALTAGIGILGANYTGAAPMTWAVDQSWLMTNYHNNLTVSNGIMFSAYASYNGMQPRNIKVDLVWLNNLKRDFYFYIQTEPTPYDTGAYNMVSTSQTNPFYYRNVTGITNTATNAGASGVSVPLVNATNVMHSTTATVPSSYAAASFTVSNMTASLSGNITYDKATSLTNSFIRTTNSAGTSITTYNTLDKMLAMHYWTDCELKIIDKWGNIIYFTSTIALNNAQVALLHPEITDKTPTIYFIGTYNSPNGCYGKKTQFTNFNSSIGATIGTSNAVSGIWIYPNLTSTETRTIPIWTGYNISSGTRNVVWGKYIREIVSNPENTIINWRQTTSQGEMYHSSKFWRPARLEYYGDLKEIQ